eukprot:2523295-Prorocentrum_lima.AAC.1
MPMKTWHTNPAKPTKSKTSPKGVKGGGGTRGRGKGKGNESGTKARASPRSPQHLLLNGDE